MKLWSDYYLDYNNERNDINNKFDRTKKKISAISALAFGCAILLGAGIYSTIPPVRQEKKCNYSQMAEIMDFYNHVANKDFTDRLSSLDSLDAKLRKYSIVNNNTIDFMQGTDYETKAHIIDSGIKGLRVMIIGGIHGDEMGSYVAAELLCKQLEVHSGTVIVLPRANVPAIEQKRRYIAADMNRQFGINNIKGENDKSAPDTPEYEMALAIKQFMIDYHIDAFMNLHEGSAKWANTITYDNPLFKGFLSDIVNSANNDLPKENRIKLKEENMPGTATYFAANELGILGFAIETPKAAESQESAYVQTIIIRKALEKIGVHTSLKEVSR